MGKGRTSSTQIVWQEWLFGMGFDDTGGERAPWVTRRDLTVEATRDGFIEGYGFALRCSHMSKRRKITRGESALYIPSL